MYTRITAVGLLAALLLLVALPPAVAGGTLEASAHANGVLLDSNTILAEFGCTAEANPDGTSFPDPLRVDLTCVVIQDGVVVAEAPAQESHLVGVTVTAGAALLDLAPFSVCYDATARFADNTFAHESGCQSFRG